MWAFDRSWKRELNKGNLHQNIFILKSGHIDNINSQDIGGLKEKIILFGRYGNFCSLLVLETRTPLHVQSKVCMPPFHVRSKVCIALSQVWSKFAVFDPHIEGSNADFAPIMEGSRADFTLHMERKPSFKDKKLSFLPFKKKIILSNLLYLRSLYNLSDYYWKEKKHF